ncbi:MAG: pseudouridylate synthase [Lysobacteraceae bacterium]|nr:MAG: pseudouridylate synthase [Xanthomonadaceae bacterium]
MPRGRGAASGVTVSALTVLYQHDALVVVDKPAGLMVHDSALARGESEFAIDRLRRQFGGPVFLVHRLDRATSGCLMLALDRDTATAMGRRLMAREVDKDYLAVCRGWPEDTGLIDHPLDGGPGKPTRKPARTAFEVLARGELPEAAAGFPTARFALLRCRPLSGRFRQIRRHLKHIRHPLVGDTSHGDGQRNRMFRARGVHRMLLHAWRLGWTDGQGRRVEVEAPLDAGFQRALDLFGWRLETASPALPERDAGTAAGQRS